VRVPGPIAASSSRPGRSHVANRTMVSREGWPVSGRRSAAPQGERQTTWQRKSVKKIAENGNSRLFHASNQYELAERRRSVMVRVSKRARSSGMGCRSAIMRQ
jgi:hypothetical protein